MNLFGWLVSGVFAKVIGRRQLLKEIEPGHRFHARYRKYRRRREQGKTSKWVSLLNLADVQDIRAFVYPRGGSLIELLRTKRGPDQWKLSCRRPRWRYVGGSCGDATAGSPSFRSRREISLPAWERTATGTVQRSTQRTQQVLDVGKNAAKQLNYRTSQYGRKWGIWNR